MSDLHNVKVGDPLIIKTGHRTEIETPVTRVGRTIVYAEIWGREMGFRKDGGADSKHTANTPGLPTVAYTPEALAEIKAKMDAWARLSALGIERGRGIKISAAALNKIIKVLEDAEG